MTRFANSQELVWRVTNLLLNKIPALQISGSRVSPSQYLSVMGQDPDSDDEDDKIAVFCIRVSDHDALAMCTTVSMCCAISPQKN